MLVLGIPLDDVRSVLVDSFDSVSETTGAVHLLNTKNEANLVIVVRL